MDNMVKILKSAIYNAVVKVTRWGTWWFHRMFVYRNYGK